jgi:NTE family protein
LDVQIREGRINKINIVGNDNANELLILREFPLRAGNLFNIELATRGLSNIFSTDLFETVSLDVDYMNEKPDVFIKVTEKPSELVRFGFRVDNERYSQIYLDFRNDNFLKSGGSLGLVTQTGFRDFFISIDYRMNRIFNTPFFTKVQTQYQFENQYQYIDDDTKRINSWNIIKTGEFKELKYGGSFTFGTLYKKLGHIAGEYKLEYQEIKPLGNDTMISSIGNAIVSSLKFGLLFDSQDQYPFPKKGSCLNIYYEFSSSLLNTGAPFTKTFFSYEVYIPFSKLSVVHPKFIFGFGDNSLPYTEQFKLGGQNSFFGLKENNYRGRQIFTGSIEYRHQVPIKFLFDTYVSLRYDIGTVWEETTAIKISSLRHGLGASLLFDTPVGPAGFSMGQVFKLTRDLPNNPISFGPFYTYLSLGFTLD